MHELAAAVQDLSRNYGLIALKAGTEWENMDYTEIAHLSSLAQGQLPTFVKIAGPEARTDLRHLRAIGINGILAPMIESEYSLEKFVLTAKEVYEGSGLETKLAINVETIQGYKKLDSLLESPHFKNIDTVVIGRLDLSLSMGISDVDHSDVVEVTRDLAHRVHLKGKHVSVGGFVNPISARSLLEIDADRLNTIHTMFDLTKVRDVTTSIWKGIEFEIAYYQSLIQINPDREEFYQSRIKTSQAKLEKARAALSGQQFVAA